MTKTLKTRRPNIVLCFLFSPVGFLLFGAIISLIFIFCHMAGLREYTVIFSGTLPVEAPAWLSASTLGCIYAAAYFAFVLVVPVLVIASALSAGMELLWPAKRKPQANGL